MSESWKIVFALSMIVLATVGGGGFLMVVLRARVKVWDSLLVPLGGKARVQLGINSVLSARLPLPDGTLVIMKQWSGRSANRAHGQIVLTLRRSGWNLSGFFLGDDAWASAFARWALKLPGGDGLGPSARPPLGQGRQQSSSSTRAALPTTVDAMLDSLGVYVAYGRNNELHLHLPGNVTHEKDLKLLEQVIQLARALTKS